MVDILRQSAIEGPGPRASACWSAWGPDGMSEKVVCEASRLASGLNARWLVLSLTARCRAGLTGTGGSARADAATCRALRRRYEAETASDFVDAILRLARKEHITQIVIGRATGRRLFRPSLPDAPLQRSGDIGVHVVPAGALPPGASCPISQPPNGPRPSVCPCFRWRRRRRWGWGPPHWWRCKPRHALSRRRAALGGDCRQCPALLASILSFLAYNFFFIDPTGKPAWRGPEEVLSLVIFVVVAMVAGQLAARLRLSADRASRPNRPRRCWTFPASWRAPMVVTVSSMPSPAISTKAWCRPVVVLTPSEEAVTSNWPPPGLPTKASMLPP